METKYLNFIDWIIETHACWVNLEKTRGIEWELFFIYFKGINKVNILTIWQLEVEIIQHYLYTLEDEKGKIWNKIKLLTTG